MSSVSRLFPTLYPQHNYLMYCYIDSTYCPSRWVLGIVRHLYVFIEVILNSTLFRSKALDSFPHIIYRLPNIRRCALFVCKGIIFIFCHQNINIVDKYQCGYNKNYSDVFPITILVVFAVRERMFWDLNIDSICMRTELGLSSFVDAPTKVMTSLQFITHK
jgi:hypothetical protein